MIYQEKYVYDESDILMSSIFENDLKIRTDSFSSKKEKRKKNIFDIYMTWINDC